MIDHMDLPVGPSPHVVAAADALLDRFGAELVARMRRGPIVRGSHARILELLAQGGLRPSAIAEGWITKQAVGQRLRELEELGLVRLRPDPSDGRATIAALTSSGARAVASIGAAIADMEEALAAEVGPERYAVFRAVLGELIDGHAPPTPGG